MNGVLSISVESGMSRKIRIKVQYPEKVQTNSNGNKLDQILRCCKTHPYVAAITKLSPKPQTQLGAKLALISIEPSNPSSRPPDK